MFKQLNWDKSCSKCSADKEYIVREHRTWWEKLLFKSRWRCTKCDTMQYLK